MASSLSNLVKNLEEKNYEIRFKDCHCFLEYERVKGNLIKYNCLSCNKDYWNKLDEKVKIKFKNTFKFSSNDINKFILLLRKDDDLFEHMDDWENFNGTKLPKQQEFDSNLNI